MAVLEDLASDPSNPGSKISQRYDDKSDDYDDSESEYDGDEKLFGRRTFKHYDFDDSDDERDPDIEGHMLAWYPSPKRHQNPQNKPNLNHPTLLVRPKVLSLKASKESLHTTKEDSKITVRVSDTEIDQAQPSSNSITDHLDKAGSDDADKTKGESNAWHDKHGSGAPEQGGGDVDPETGSNRVRG